MEYSYKLMYKTHNWNKKQLLKLDNASKQLSKYFHMYKLRNDIIFPSGYTTPSVDLIGETVREFLEHRENIPTLTSSTKSFFKKIKNYDKIAVVDDKKVLFNSYKILQFIYIYINLFEIQKDASYKKHTFAYYKSDKQKYLKKYKKHCSELKEPDCTEEGSHKIMKFAYLFYNKSTDIIDTFFNQMVLIPFHQLKDFDEESYEMNIIRKSADFFSSTNFSSYQPIYKSLGIILVSYLTTKMNVPNKDAVEAVNTLYRDLFYDITEYDYEINISAKTLLKNVYITGRLNSIPIFASRDNDEPYSDNILNGIAKIYEEIEKDIDVDMSFLDYKEFSPLNNLPLVYLNLSPTEILQPYV